MYFPKGSSSNIEEMSEYLVKKLGQFKEDYGSLYGEVEWKAILVSRTGAEKEEWELYASTFYVHQKTHQKEENQTWIYDVTVDEEVPIQRTSPFSKVALIRRYLSFEQIIEFINQINQQKKNIEEENKEKITVAIADLQFTISKIKSTSIDFTSAFNPEMWSRYTITINHQTIEPTSNEDLPLPLFSPEYPYFPRESSGYVMTSFFNIPWVYPNKNQILIILPLYDAKIEQITLSGTRLLVKVVNNTNNSLVLKVQCFADWKRKNVEWILPPNEELHEFELEENYQTIYWALAKEQSPHIIQYHGIRQMSIAFKDVTIPSSIEELRQFIKHGEDQFREFKKTFDVRNVVREMMAFANTNDGIVCIGVDDDGITLVGIDDEPQKVKDKIVDHIAKTCEPQFKEYDVNHFNYGDNKYIYQILVQEGKNKPYFYNNMIYVRAKGTTRPIGREELMKMMENSKREW